MFRCTSIFILFSMNWGERSQWSQRNSLGTNPVTMSNGTSKVIWPRNYEWSMLPIELFGTLAIHCFSKFPAPVWYHFSCLSNSQPLEFNHVQPHLHDQVNLLSDHKEGVCLWSKCDTTKLAKTALNNIVYDSIRIHHSSRTQHLRFGSLEKMVSVLWSLNWLSLGVNCGIHQTKRT